MVTAANISPGDDVPTADQRIVLNGVSWEHYEVELALRGDKAGPKLAFLEGAMELRSPSKEHERITSYLGRLVELYAEVAGIELSPYRSWTLKRGTAAAAAEPDECYIVGEDQGGALPDLVIEVVWTSGGLDKLEVYRRLGVAELWCWVSGRIQVYVLEGGAFRAAASSARLPGLDLDLLCQFLDRPTVQAAKRAYREALAARGA